MLKKIVKWTVLVIATIVLTLTSFTSTILAASKTPSWGHWDDTTITYKTASTSSYYKGVWKNAVKRWNKVGVVQLRAAKSGEKADITLTSSKSLSTKSGKLAGYTNYSYLKKSDNNNEIVSATSTLNRSLLSKYKYSKNQRTNVATHEIGHAIGLSHSKSEDSVMYASDRYASIDHQDKVGLQSAYED
ncbi:matrixin family metalloprotease [Levilactobacillus humaensis]|uniref:matrixin family metalloprotease n=1 Tax=Levilactobacillus humaensis TaxID=2950375 RepID=UPI0021C27CE9|nr:M57 family metalloprotease [Levilactobacillus humaensis]